MRPKLFALSLLVLVSCKARQDAATLQSDKPAATAATLEEMLRDAATDLDAAMLAFVGETYVQLPPPPSDTAIALTSDDVNTLRTRVLELKREVQQLPSGQSSQQLTAVLTRIEGLLASVQSARPAQDGEEGALRTLDLMTTHLRSMVATVTASRNDATAREAADAERIRREQAAAAERARREQAVANCRAGCERDLQYCMARARESLDQTLCRSERLLCVNECVLGRR